jgi:hypothetical protein
VSVSPSTTRGARARLARVGLLALALAAAAVLLLLASACGGSSSAQGVAQVDSTETTTTDSTSAQDSADGSSSADPAAYSACMRKNGVPKFPDPDSEGRLLLRAGPGTGIDPESPQFKAAAKACQKLAPKAPSPAQQAKDREQLLKFSACMRENGVPTFPDPKFNPDGSGGITLDKGVDRTPQFKAAEKACRELLPGGGERRGPSTNGPGGTP